MDFHPGNIMMRDQDPVIIDWMTVGLGDRCADVARTNLILNFGEMPMFMALRNEMMNLTKLVLKTADEEQIPLIKKLYKKAFPRQERKPFFIITKGQKQGNMEILALTDDHFVGLGITMFYKDMVMLDYFAIDENIRSKGYGSKALELLNQRYEGKRFFLEIEQPNENVSNNAERNRRKKFYLNHGFTEAEIYVKLFGVNMEVLCYGCEVTFAEYYSLYRHNLGDFIAQKNIRQRIV